MSSAVDVIVVLKRSPVFVIKSVLRLIMRNMYRVAVQISRTYHSTIKNNCLAEICYVVILREVCQNILIA